MTPNKNIRKETEPVRTRNYTGTAGKKVGTAFKKVLGGEIQKSSKKFVTNSLTPNQNWANSANNLNWLPN